MAAGLVVLLAGCSVAIYRSWHENDGPDRDSEAEDLLTTVSNDFISGSGALSLSRLASGYDRIDIGDGRSVRIRVETIDGSGLTIYIPDRETFEKKDIGDTTPLIKVLPISMDDGRVIPGRLEVMLVG
ncbi:MAG: hypothetical protein JXA22_02090 [Candidatus Thermoplasmatota archaeon]|nr:hypothetical protein [Candidatus Thermoplasmatota archaeon]